MAILRIKKRKLFVFSVPPSASRTPDDPMLLKQYEILVDLYKHWLECRIHSRS